MAVLTIHHYLDIIKSFINDVETSKNSYYLFAGKPDPWLNPAGQNDDSANNITTYQSANSSVYQHESSIYHDAIFGKIITPEMIEYLIPRINWTSNTYYDQYDQFDADLLSKQFYVVTDSMEVYKVIDNNNGSASTIKPTLTTQSGTFMTSDGYIWKYMYTVDTNSNTLFTTTNFIPVKANNAVIANAMSGTIDAIRLTNGGNNYPYYTGYLVASANNKSLVIDDGASYSNDYYTQSSIYLQAGYGSGQIRKIVKYDGLNKILTVDSAFDNYITFNITDITAPDSFVAGNILTQNVDSLATLYSKGIFQINDSIVQSDTGAVATILIANSTVFKVTKSPGSNAFSLSLPVYNTSQGGTLKSGKATVTPFSVLSISSNTGAFTVGEWIYQSNGSANTANGVVVAANSSKITVGRVSGSFGTNSTANSVKGNTSSSNATVTLVSSNNTGNTYIYSTNTAQTAFTTDFANNSYIRIGDNSNNNIRRVTSVNSTVVIVDTPLSAGVIANTIYDMPYAFEPSSITLTSATGVISNTNIYGIKIGYTEKTNLGINFTVGEKVDMVDVSNTTQSVYGIVSYANTTTVVLTGVTGGSFSTTLAGGANSYLRGESSLQRGKINIIDSYPNITIRDPLGTYIPGIPVNTRDTDKNILGSANVLSYYIIPNQLTEYVISPTVTITGDGSNAIAYSEVDTSLSSKGPVSKIIVLDTGLNYTYANVTIVSNSGSGAEAYGVVAPVAGHGYDAYAELGARYAGITTTFANGLSESYRYPVYGTYRRIGLIKNPLFTGVTVNLDTFDRVRLTVNTVVGAGFSTNEYVLQSNSGAIGRVVYANTSHIELKAIKGTFSANLKFANGSSANDRVIGLTSNTRANVAISNIVYFTTGTGVETVSEITTGANGLIVSTPTNTQVLLTDVYGDFAIGDTMYDPVTNAYANVASIYIANGKIDVSTVFAKKFNQTVRFPLTGNSAPYAQFERVTQEYSNASGMIISNNNEQDVAISNTAGFSVGDVVRNSTNAAGGILTYANNTYLRITAVNGMFRSGETIINNLNVSATISNAYNVLVLSNIGGSGLFSSGTLSGNVTGSTSGSTGKCAITDSVILHPDLVINTGEVTYLENISSPFQLSNNSKETVQIVIKF